MIKNILFAIIGGIVGSYITLRFEIWKAWKSYIIVREEIERNLRLLEMVQRATTPKYISGTDGQQVQIDQMIDSSKEKLPVRISLLARESMPNWAHQAWDSQLHLLAHILTEPQVKGIFEIQTDLERLSSIHALIGELVIKYGGNARYRCLELFKEWESGASRLQQNGNPLPVVPIRIKIASVLGFHRFFR